MNITKTKLGTLAGVIGMSGVALGLLGTGVGAEFVQSATANAHISVGTLDCTLSGAGVTVSNNGHTADFTLAQIESSTPSHETMPVTVTNSGSTPVYVNWEVTESGDIFNSGAVTSYPVPSGVGIASGSQHTYNLGAQWTTLTNADMGTSGTVSYTAYCTDTKLGTNLQLWSQDGGTAAWNQQGTISLAMPANTGSGVNAGAGVQVLNQGPNLPATAPSFTTDTYNSGSPRWYIQFTNGASLEGYPANAGPGVANLWSENNAPTYQSWSTVYSADSGYTVSGIYIVMDQDQPNGTATISNISYGGNTLLGS